MGPSSVEATLLYIFFCFLNGSQGLRGKKPLWSSKFFPFIADHSLGWLYCVRKQKGVIKVAPVGKMTEKNIDVYPLTLTV